MSDVDDDFTGSDGDPPDTELWEYAGSDTEPEIDDNKLLVTANGGGP